LVLGFHRSVLSELTERLCTALKASSTSPPKPLPSALSGNEFQQSL
jgi:hypothetical protein